MCLFSKVKDLRGKLLRNCKYAIDRLEAAKKRVYYFSNTQKDTISATDTSMADTTEKRVSYYSSNNQKDATTGPSATDTPMADTTDSPQIAKKPESDIRFENEDEEIMNSFMILTHGVLIQEWELFLYGVFAEGVIYYLRGYNFDSPRFNINFKNLKPTKEIAALHENIASEAIESFKGYKQLIDQSLKLFWLTDVKKSEVGKEMKKHVIIRNIWQHSRGKIRPQDLEEYGKNGQYFELFDDEGKLNKRVADDPAILSRKDIYMLFDTIEKYSEKFQVQAEKARPPITDSTD